MDLDWTKGSIGPLNNNSIPPIHPLCADPSIKKGEWSAEEDAILVAAQAEYGNKWTEIARLLPGRSENTVKNR